MITTYSNGMGEVFECGGCSGKGGLLVQQGGGANLWRCDGCGGLIGRATIPVLRAFVGFDEPMQAEATTPEALTYFDVELADARGRRCGARVHGWYDASTRKVVQYG